MDGAGIGRDDRGAGRRRVGFLLAIVVSGLLGALLGGWAKPPVPATDVPGAAAAGGLPPAIVIAMGLLLLAAVALLVRRSRLAVPDGVSRDPQTGLYLDSFVSESLRNQFAREDRDGHSRLALVLIEIDAVEDLRRRYGEEVIRDAVALLGRQIRGQVRQGDLPMRLRGGRFAVYLQCEEMDQAAAFCRRVAMLLARDQLELRGDVIKPTFSTGIVLREPGESIEALDARADAKLRRKLAAAVEVEVPGVAAAVKTSAAREHGQLQ